MLAGGMGMGFFLEYIFFLEGLDVRVRGRGKMSLLLPFSVVLLLAYNAIFCQFLDFLSIRFSIKNSHPSLDSPLQHYVLQVLM